MSSCILLNLTAVKDMSGSSIAAYLTQTPLYRPSLSLLMLPPPQIREEPSSGQTTSIQKAYSPPKALARAVIDELLDMVLELHATGNRPATKHLIFAQTKYAHDEPPNKRNAK
ncbi:hypothetical protein SLS58_006130 [Diplodia intermedia]|uniref:Uncharacterized protein n=1 Tax=Diplodia intermedia TaxID=856260 RepID=A0ABR3TNY7_9PEZI